MTEAEQQIADRQEQRVRVTVTKLRQAKTEEEMIELVNSCVNECVIDEDKRILQRYESIIK